MTIEFPNNSLIQLQFQDFDIDPNVYKSEDYDYEKNAYVYDANCKLDWLQIYGNIVDLKAVSTTNATIEIDDDKGIRLCGNTIPTPITVNGSKLNLLFRSDGSIARKGIKMIVTKGTDYDLYF